MQIVFKGENLHVISKSIFVKEKKNTERKYFRMSSAEMFTQDCKRSTEEKCFVLFSLFLNYFFNRS